MSKTHFNNKLLPYILLAPQIIITAVFFLWPAYTALKQSVYVEDPFGLNPAQFVGLENFNTLFADSDYMHSFWITLGFSISVAVLSMIIALFLAGFVHRIIKLALVYRTFVIIPYAIAPVLAGTLWMFLFDPTLGIISNALATVGIDWNHQLSGTHAMILIILAATWNRISYNFLFFVAALQSIPNSLIEAATIDGANAWQRFRDIMLPLISPTSFFLLVMNIVFAFFETFGIVHAITHGGPGNSTEILVYKVFKDGFIGLDFGSSATQSVILIVMVMLLTFIQFRFVEKRISYD